MRLFKMKNKIFALLFFCCGCHADMSVNPGEQYLGTKYVLNPLGEEMAPDKDPLIRTDAFDCTTFVETVLANEDKNRLNQIRYKNGVIDFTNRNHFIETDWLINNSDIVKNVSSNYGKTAIRHVVNNKKSWFKHVFDIDTDFENQSADLEYIPYKNLSKINIQTPLIVLFIHDGDGFYDKIGTDLAVVHMGFLLPGNILRHASHIQGCVTDTDFAEYVNKRKKNKHNIGVALLEIK